MQKSIEGLLRCHMSILRAVRILVVFCALGDPILWSSDLDQGLDEEGYLVLSYESLLGGSYRVESSSDLKTWEELSAWHPGMNRSVELVAPLDSRSRFYRLSYDPPEQLKEFQPISTFCAVGDSITDRSSFNLDPSFDGLGSSLSGWGAILEQSSNGRFMSVARTNAFKVDRDHGYSGITTWMYLDGGGWLPEGLIPLDDAIASGADCFIVHIGTNDVAGSTPPEVVSRIQRIWSELVATGKPVIGTDILQRSTSYPGWTEELRDRVNEINTALRDSWKEYDLASYRYWDHLIEKDNSGFAIDAEFPNDGVHPTMRVGLKLGFDLHGLLSTRFGGNERSVPSLSSNCWLTPNPEVSGGSTLATSWNALSLGVEGGDVVFSKLTDSAGDWQAVEIIAPVSGGMRGVYSRQVGAGVTWNVGGRCRASATVRVPEGTSFSGIGISVQCVGALNPWIDCVSAPYSSSPSPVDGFEITMVSDPFTIPEGTTQLWFLLRVPGGAGKFEFRDAGVFREEE